LAGGSEVLELASDRRRPEVQSYKGAYESFVIGREVSEQLKGLSRQEGATLYMVLLAVFQLLLHRYSGQRQISVGAGIGNRNRAEIEGLIGFFVNTLVMRLELGGNPNFRELLARVRELTLGAYAHQDLPFEYLVKELEPERSLGHTPLFQVMFALQNAPVGKLELKGLRLGLFELENRTAKHD